MKDQNKCLRCAKRTSIIGFVSGIFLAAFKLTIGFLGRSHALVASGMCNISDVSSSLAVLLGVKYSQKSANKRYQYGYGKMEFVVQVGISGLMILGTVLLILSSFIVLAKRAIIIPHMLVFFTAILSAIINGLIYKFSTCGAKKLNSPALKSHAEHNKIDVASSLLVAVGVLAARIGLHWADPLIAIFESAHVIHASLVIFRGGLKSLLDVSMPLEYIERIKKSAIEVENVLRVALVRARQSGQKIFLDIAIEVNPDLSVIASKNIMQSLKAHLRETDKHIGNIFVKIVPAG